MVASDCRGTSLVFRGVFVALGSRIIPEDTVIKEGVIPTDVPQFLSSSYKLYINFEKRIKKYYLYNK